MEIRWHTWGKKDRNQLALAMMLFFVTIFTMLWQFDYVYYAYLAPKAFEIASGGQAEALTQGEHLFQDDLADHWNVFLFGTGVSLCLLPLYIAWAAKSPLWGRKGKIVWIAVIVLFNSLGMFAFANVTTARKMMRRPPKRLRKGAVVRAERFLAKHELDRESLDDRQFQFMGRRLERRRAMRLFTPLMICLAITWIGFAVYAIDSLMTVMNGLSSYATVELDTLAEMCECEEIDRFAEGMEDMDVVLSSRKIAASTTGFIVFFAALFGIFVGMTFMAAAMMFGLSIHETRTIQEFLNTTNAEFGREENA